MRTACTSAGASRASATRCCNSTTARQYQMTSNLAMGFFSLQEYSRPMQLSKCESTPQRCASGGSLQHTGGSLPQYREFTATLQGGHCHTTGGSLPHYRGVAATLQGGHCLRHPRARVCGPGPVPLQPSPVKPSIVDNGVREAATASCKAP